MGNENYLFLMHHGIKGMHWGVRRFQNKDGTLTAAGKERYSDGDGANNKRQTTTDYNYASNWRKGFNDKRLMQDVASQISDDDFNKILDQYRSVKQADVDMRSSNKPFDETLNAYDKEMKRLTALIKSISDKIDNSKIRNLDKYLDFERHEVGNGHEHVERSRFKDNAVATIFLDRIGEPKNMYLFRLMLTDENFK